MRRRQSYLFAFVFQYSFGYLASELNWKLYKNQGFKRRLHCACWLCSASYWSSQWRKGSQRQQFKVFVAEKGQAACIILVCCGFKRFSFCFFSSTGFAMMFYSGRVAKSMRHQLSSRGKYFLRGTWLRYLWPETGYHICLCCSKVYAASQMVFCVLLLSGQSHIPKKLLDLRRSFARGLRTQINSNSFSHADWRD